jgi:uncharacterized phage protein (TIGR01671 family)
MNRPIKFRYVYKHCRTGEIKTKELTIDEIEVGGNAVWGVVHGWIDEGYLFESRDQYTGLQDKNGTPIYEGDILKTFKGNFEVKWEAYQFVLPGFYCGSNDVPYDYFSEQGEDEVIGNVWEHPCLLEKPI